MRSTQLGFLAAISIFVSQPAWAQTAPVPTEMEQALAACLFSDGNAASTQENLTQFGWTGETDTGAGITYIYPPTGENTIVAVGIDNSVCYAESSNQGSDVTAKQLLGMFEATIGASLYSQDVDEMGCTKFSFAEGASATVLSGADDPVCSAENSSAVRFQFPVK